MTGDVVDFLEFKMNKVEVDLEAACELIDKWATDPESNEIYFQIPNDGQDIKVLTVSKENDIEFKTDFNQVIETVENTTAMLFLMSKLVGKKLDHVILTTFVAILLRCSLSIVKYNDDHNKFDLGVFSNPDHEGLIMRHPTGHFIIISIMEKS